MESAAGERDTGGDTLTARAPTPLHGELNSLHAAAPQAHPHGFYGLSHAPAEGVFESQRPYYADLTEEAAERGLSVRPIHPRFQHPNSSLNFSNSAEAHPVSSDRALTLKP